MKLRGAAGPSVAWGSVKGGTEDWAEALHLQGDYNTPSLNGGGR